MNWKVTSRHEIKEASPSPREVTRRVCYAIREMILCHAQLPQYTFEISMNEIQYCVVIKMTMFVLLPFKNI